MPEEELQENMGESVGVEPENLPSALDEAKRELAAYRRMLQKMKADFSNYKRRVEQERDEQQRISNAELIKKILPVLDDFSRALKALPEEEKKAQWTEGVALIERKLQSILEDAGAERIPATSITGQPFDPQQHEAVLYEEVEESQDGRVKAVIQEGYKLRGMVLRPALVVVGKRRLRDDKHDGERAGNRAADSN
ncbi:MAG: nucleotide exchange factor GrpE [Chloroflexi bacterium]|nr:nucleotide exchange factor GrpE [Chloroflexota bacterium]